MTKPGTKIKICGLTRPDDCRAVNDAGADYAGFVFAPSRRRVDIETAAGLIALLGPAMVPVGVFVDETVGEIVRTVQGAGLSMVQLHGEALPDKLTELRSHLSPDVGIWQRLAVPLGVPSSIILSGIHEILGKFSAMNALPDIWLLDSSRQGQAGGTGLSFDWPAFASLELTAPLALAGGLSPDNVILAINALQPAIVDASSGVETDGIKDPEKIRQFCANVRYSLNKNQTF